MSFVLPEETRINWEIMMLRVGLEEKANDQLESRGCVCGMILCCFSYLDGSGITTVFTGQ